MKTILTIAGVSFDGPSRALNGFVGLNALRYELDGYDSLEFSVSGCGPNPPFPPGVPVQLVSTNDDGSNPIVRFVGDLNRPDCRFDDGWAFGYSCTDLKARADRCTLIAGDGSGSFRFNLEQTDPNYTQSQAGLTVGQMVAAVLLAPDVAAQLAQAGIGNYGTTQGGATTLPAATQADLAALDIVPPEPVELRGQGVFNQIKDLVEQWHPQVFTAISPTGLWSFKPMAGFPTRPLLIPGDFGGGDPVDPPDYSVDLTNCYTQIVIKGQDIDAFFGSLKEGTLSLASTTQNLSSATVKDFYSPRDAVDQGNCSNVTSTSCTVTSDDPTAYWAANFWQARGAVVDFISKTLGDLVESTQRRTITTCSALSPGGSATIGWDPSNPISTNTYTRYRLVGVNSPLAEVWRRMHIRNPNTGSLDLATFYGPRLATRFPKGFPWANNMGVTQIFYPTAVVQWAVNRPTSGAAKPPYFEVSLPIEVDKTNGQVVLTKPAPLLSAGYQACLNGYPTTEAAGAPHDVIVCVPYNRGAMNALAPAAGGFVGTAYTQYGLRRTRYYVADTFVNRGDMASYQKLAAERLAVVQDAVVSGSILHHGMPASFDPMAMGYALKLSVANAPSPLDGVPLPVRTLRVSWPNAGPDLVTVQFDFSNLKRPFEGDALYVHPQFALGNLGGDAGGDDAFGGLGPMGIVAGFDAYDAEEGSESPGESTADLVAGRQSKRQAAIDATARTARADRATPNRGDEPDDGPTRQQSIDMRREAARERPARDYQRDTEQAMLAEANRRRAPEPPPAVVTGPAGEPDSEPSIVPRTRPIDLADNGEGGA